MGQAARPLQTAQIAVNTDTLADGDVNRVRDRTCLCVKHDHTQKMMQKQ